MTHNKNISTASDSTTLKQLIDTELQFEPFDFNQNTIHGVPVYTRHLPFAPCIHIRIGFRYGAIHDEPGKEGTAHFLEHMIFDGSSMFKDEHETQEFGKTVMLDTLNAHTGLFELFVVGKCLPHNTKLSLDGIFSMIHAPTLSEKSFEHEKKVITQEAWGVFLNQTRIEYVKKERANVFSDLPDRQRIASALGWPDTVASLTLEDIQNAHKTYFIAENMEIYIAGNLASLGTDEQSGKQTLIELLTKHLSRMPHGNPAKHPFIPETINPPIQTVFDLTYKETGLSERQQANIAITSHLPRIKKVPGQVNSPEEDMFVAAQSLASDLMSDLVHRKLRLENSWCYAAGAQAYPTSDMLEFSVGGSIDPKFINEAIDIIWNIIEDIKKGEYKDDFEKTKRLIVENRIAKERNTEDILYDTVSDIRVDGKITSLKDYLYRIATIEFADVQNVFKTYFVKENTFTQIIRPDAV